MEENVANILILGAAGKDFHVFNTIYRESLNSITHWRQFDRVVAFTATQIPDISGRRYPPELSGKHYPEGIPIYDENDLEKVIQDHKVNHAVFAYSDVNFEYIHALRERVQKAGATFGFPDQEKTFIRSNKPVISVVAIRTGSGKSQTSRYIVKCLQDQGKKVVSIRHPMPYGDLVAQRVQRFATLDDLKKHDCTIEEMEEYEPHIMAGCVVYAGVDYEAILKEAEKEADVILWDVANGKEIQRFSEHTGPIWGLDFRRKPSRRDYCSQCVYRFDCRADFEQAWIKTSGGHENSLF